ncbi:MAG: type I-U CRISPR-associated protein Cas7 [Acidobacteria bacterium RIFCSPLOWO2_02_FULL_68_18]|nr:MAG: type I-U CRISPR-associated protein Cas7 [Acidobacteria bacterium RIFCSPLOWO2_02_FULL_68_18]OFW48705.1 MAG: type I-U CRISPR-associated protein Cas7 [Acidobacteria bacterium RIFCSPLOWO2_12_FULL_68_19]
MSEIATKFDSWLEDGSDIAALVMRQWLLPIEGKEGVIFPPTYAKPERMRDEDWTGYNIDRFEDGTNVCQIDSVGSQANRMEPIFKRKKYRHLVPQIVIVARENGQTREVHLLDAGHRAADAIVRFSTIGPQLFEAFLAFQRTGNAERLARIAPTSLVFGSWDSRATQAKLPRIVRSVIRAFNVQAMHRSAQYSTIAGEILEGSDAEVTVKGPKAELGLAHVPAVMTHGGVWIKNGSEIRRDAVLSLVPLRALCAESGQGEDTLVLRRYILGVALVAFSAPPETCLREGCQVVPDKSRPAELSLVNHDGGRDEWVLTDRDALAFADEAAKAFHVQQPSQSAEWDGELARTVLGLNEQQRKELLRGGPVTRARLEQVSSQQSTRGRGTTGRNAARAEGQGAVAEPDTR